MSSQTISFLLQSCILISESIFLGAKILAPLILILKISNIKIKWPDLFQLVKSLNSLILTGGILFLVSVLINTYISLRYADDFQLNFMIGMLTGPHWYQFVLPIFNFGILPNVLWFRKLRYSIYSSFFIVIYWLSSNYFIEYLARPEKTMLSSDTNHFTFNFVEYTEKGIIFIILISGLYIILNSNKKRIDIG